MPPATDNPPNHLIGRGAELQILLNTLKGAVEQGANTAIYLHGEHGVGKSRLIEELLTRFDQDCHTFTITCNPTHQQPLDAITAILQSCFDYQSTLPAAEGLAQFRARWQQLAGEELELQRIESIIASQLGFVWEGSTWSLLPAPEKPAQLRSAFVSLIERLTRERPLLLLIDDGQWLDAASLEYLQVITPGNPHPLLLLTACRFLEEGKQVDFELTGFTRLNIHLQPLAAAINSELICSLLLLPGVPEATLHLIQEQASGNPLFTEQLCTFLLENDNLTPGGELQGDLEQVTNFGMGGVIDRRIEQLAPPLRTVVSAAGVLGMQFNRQVLNHMLGRDTADDLKTGETDNLWQRLNEWDYSFAHILILEAACRRLEDEQLQELHRLAAAALAAICQDDPDTHAEEIGSHFEQAGDLPQTADYYNRAGNYYREQGEYAQAVPLLRRALAIREQTLGEEHLDTASTLNNLALVLKARGEFDEVEPLYKRALAIREAILGASHTETAQLLSNIASLYSTQARYAEAEPLHKRVLMIMETTHGSRHPETAISLNSLALVYKYQGRYGEAEQLYQRSLLIREEAQGPDHPSVAVALNNLAYLYLNQERYAEAETLSSRALAIQEAALGGEHPGVAITLNTLAGAHWKQKRYDVVEPLLQRALVIRERTLGREHPLTAVTLNNLASLYRDQARYEEAESLLLRALAASEKSAGPAHPYTATMLQNLASVYKDQGRNEAAEPLFKKTLAIREAALGAEHPETKNALQSLVEFYSKIGDEEQAAGYRTRLTSSAST